MSKNPLASLAVFSLFALLALHPAHAQNGKKEYGVYQYVVQSAPGTFADISAALENAARAAGWRLLAKVDAGVPENCPYKVRVFVLYDSAYGWQIMQANRQTGPFAVVDRVNLFEDENGIHIAVVNPHSINRTVLMDDQKYEAMTATHLQVLRNMIGGAVQGKASDKQYGQMRAEGYIGKTMGVMAGGRFDGKLVEQAKVPGGNWKEVAAKVRQGLSQKGKLWGMHLIYELELPEYETVVFGTTGTPMDGKSFSIVGAGADETRDKLQCPGLAHAAAYPIEIVVAKEGDVVKVRLVEVMFRMKMYFEDAGKWAFMKNVRMPGSIQDELAAQIKMGLNAR
ncbi:MAG: hypothetical protein ONB48_19630 [candidate division KSB1 bacterium]|nr:hypothetical protein [candidate division KSB1 bacterium]MDZ7274098.1 hypothetical protein [candidate division KSB1 bacterium]MDZ7287858.1 hypothetical protein [candidate division KSB1 bacterium]MDZ7296696.1 hypothetical protein [candidate division KSB1 bacterium]MDZ7306934.1 hypothetical protein [candidate division KSB1 bacterium]